MKWTVVKPEEKPYVYEVTNDSYHELQNLVEGCFQCLRVTGAHCQSMRMVKKNAY